MDGGRLAHPTLSRGEAAGFGSAIDRQADGWVIEEFSRLQRSNPFRDTQHPRSTVESRSNVCGAIVSSDLSGSIGLADRTYRQRRPVAYRNHKSGESDCRNNDQKQRINNGGSEALQISTIPDVLDCVSASSARSDRPEVRK